MSKKYVMYYVIPLKRFRGTYQFGFIYVAKTSDVQTTWNMDNLMAWYFEEGGVVL